MKATSVRLDEPLATALEMIAKIEGVSVSDEIRRAIVDYVERKRVDEAFREQVAARMSLEQRKLRDVFGDLPEVPTAATGTTA